MPVQIPARIRPDYCFCGFGAVSLYIVSTLCFSPLTARVDSNPRAGYSRHNLRSLFCILCFRLPLFVQKCVCICGSVLVPVLIPLLIELSCSGSLESEFRTGSYGSLPTPAMAMSGSSSPSSSIRSRDEEAPSENTPLLPPVNGSRRIDEDQVGIRGIVDDGSERSGLLSLLSKIGPTSISIEAEAVPAIECLPDENGDTSLPTDGALKYDADPMRDDGEEEMGEMAFHGGTSKRQFWVIFAGEFPVLRVGNLQSLTVSPRNPPRKLPRIVRRYDNGLNAHLRHVGFPCFGAGLLAVHILPPDGDKFPAAVRKG